MAVTQDLNILPLPGSDPYDLSIPQNALALSARINRLIHVDRFQRQQFEREWFRNVLFYVGQQWIIFDRGKWRPKNLPSWFPRAMTNKFAEKINDFVTTLVQGGRTPINYLPAREDQEDDKAIAEISELIRSVLYEEADIDDESPTLAMWIGACGNGFVIPYYDWDEKYGTFDDVQLQQCQNCAQNPPPADASSNDNPSSAGPSSDSAQDGDENQNPPTSAPQAPKPAQYSPQDIVDAGGVCPVCGGSDFAPGDTQSGGPKGKFRTDVCSPFEIRLDHRITKWDTHKKFVRMRMRDLDEAKQKYPDIAAHITADHENDLGQFYLNALAHVTAAFGISGGFVGGAANPLGPKTVEYELFELPDAYYPEGIHCIRIGANSDLVVEAGPLDSEYGAGPQKGQKFLPLVKFGFDRVPGRMWSKTRADDVVPLQLFRNIVEACLRLTAQRMGNGMWLDPKGSGVEILTGEPGQVIKYNPVSVGGTSFAKPERIPAELSNVMPLIALMNKIDDSIERVMGTFFLQGGETPPGVTAACQSADTECLTKRGWLLYNQLLPSDLLYSVNMVTGEGEWSALKKVHIFPDFSGPVYRMDGRELSFIATENHAWPIQKKGRRGLGPITRTETRHLVHHDVLPTGAPLRNTPTARTLDSVKLAAWIFAEGHYVKPSAKKRTKHWTVVITQSHAVNADKCELIRGVLRAEDITFREYRQECIGRTQFYIYGVQADSLVAQYPDKRPPIDWLTSLNKEEALAFCYALISGDGHIRSKNGVNFPNEELFTNSDPVLADAFQVAATIAGRNSSRNTEIGGNMRPHQSHRSSDDMYTVSLKQMETIQIGALVKTRATRENYKGLVWCPETASGTWVARRTGKVMLTCNSALAYL